MLMSTEMAARLPAALVYYNDHKVSLHYESESESELDILKLSNYELVCSFFFFFSQSALYTGPYCSTEPYSIVQRDKT